MNPNASPFSPRHWQRLASLVGSLFVASSAAAQSPQLLFSEGFESGWNGWTNDTTYTTDPRYAWVVGPPARGPATAHTGTNCAGTYNPGNDCYLVSPPLLLPPVNQYSNHLWLFYWQWQKYLQVSTNVCLSDVKIRQHLSSPIGDYWGPWNIIDPGTSGVIDGNSPVWRRRGIDLTLFNGGIVQLGFDHGGIGDPGWLIDDVEVWNVPVPASFPGIVDFESGWGAWHTDHGVWDIGVPTGNGPTNVPSGSDCAGTALDGVPPIVSEAHLWTPPFYLTTLNPGERVYLQFEQWYDAPNAFDASIQYSQWWSSIGWTWPQNIDSDLLIIPTQRQWTTITKDITSLAAAGQILPLRFGFDFNNVFTNRLGWFIDNVRIVVAHFRIESIQPQGNNLQLTWSAPAGTTNVLQCSPGLTAAFTNVSPSLIATGTAQTVTAYVHNGAAGSSSLFYRVRRLP
jgi:hypothetical protein